MERGNFAEVAEALLTAKCIKFGEFTLKSGGKSPVYIDLRMLRSFPEQKSTVASAYIKMIESVQQESGIPYDLIADVPTGVTPLVSSISDRLWIPQISPRVETKDHGTKAKIEGDYLPGQKVALVEDLVTKGTSIIEARQVLLDGDLLVPEAYALVDRIQGGREKLAAAGCNLITFATLPMLIYHYRDQGKITEEQFQKTIAIWD